MSSDWLNEQIEAERRRDEEQRDDASKAKLAISGAGRLFTDLREQVDADIKRYRSAGGKSIIEYESVHPKSFRVRCPVYPAIALEADLSETTIHYRYWKKFDDTASGTW